MRQRATTFMIDEATVVLERYMAQGLKEGVVLKIGRAGVRLKNLSD